ncbi:HDA3 [Candida oxycetoniae]|uniref:HDA3 n=1 Tax=Candida oxycetoniae TaxID=497107 RepID=A0AAI9T144_9ASCO|nr:HDA3 [Candida oxycetoniae]KAI3406936.2 HDA3 [Candida oxycetoniae]
MNLLKILDSTPEPPIIELDLSESNFSGDYQLGTPMYEYQKELTDQIISLHYPDILKYCETNDHKELLVKSLETCIENCMLVNTHPYLLISHYMPKNLVVKDMPAKLADTSGKFNVLKDLVNTIIASESFQVKNVGLVSSNNIKLFDLLESLLMICGGNKCVKRYVGNNIQRGSKKANKGNGINGSNTAPNTTKKSAGSGGGGGYNFPTIIHLLPTDGDIQRDRESFENTKFDILIVIDGNVDTNSDFYQLLKSQNRTSEEEKPAVTIRLIPLKTVEQITLVYQDDKNTPGYLYKLISSIVCLRDYIGNIPPDVFPIYNQKLKYLAPNFFNHLFNKDKSDFPAWPLPPLPSIQKYTPIDVERSLLTEAHFHYTPYGSNAAPQEEAAIPSYYELKRLQSDYMNNPLKNDYNELIGISGQMERESTVLTHKTLLQLNSNYLRLSRAQQELKSYEEFETPEVGNRVGRREREMRITVSKLFDDLDHSRQRINSGNKWITKKQEQIEQLKNETKEKETVLRNYESNVDDADAKKFVRNQLRIWELQTQIKTLIARIQSKNDEKNFAYKEYQNTLTSISDSKKEQEEVESELKRLCEKYDGIEQEQENKTLEFKKRKKQLTDDIEEVEASNATLERRLHGAFKFLKDTSYLKKRKARTSTPNK